MNDVMSLGLHRIWKRQLLVWLRPNSGENWLDLCCGTGDLALGLARRVSSEGKVFGLDSAEKTLFIAKKRAMNEKSLSINWLKADALKTGLPPKYFDGVVMAYGLRNLADPFEGLKEIHRVLRPGAKAGLLDFNHIQNAHLQASFQKAY